MLLGAELEFAVVNDPREDSTHDSEYEIISAYDKSQSKGRTHTKHGRIARAVEAVTNDFVEVGYDATACATGDERDGFELKGKPASLEDNQLAWSRVYDSWIRDHFDPVRGGMHVHVSGPEITYETTLKLHKFIGNPANQDLIVHVAGRYNTTWCPLGDHSTDDIAVLFHSGDCRREPLRNKKIDRSESPRASGHTFCCANMREFRSKIGSFRREALNLLPHDGTGDLEFRLFKTPLTKVGCAANLEFVHALIMFCEASEETTSRAFCQWLSSPRDRRAEYRNLFRHLRDGNFVEGLIPRLG